MDYSNLKHIYFLGIGGIGMSALARYFMYKEVSVSGYDRVSTRLTNKLQAEGMQIHFDDDPAKVPGDIDLVILTPAIPPENKELHYLKEVEIPILKRAEVLGELTRDHFTIAVAGTHGKTTISSMIAHILKEQNISLCAFVGGIMTNYDSNFLYTGDGRTMIVEADEFDRSFLKLQPDFALISAVDADHLDIYGDHDELKKNFSAFAGRIKKNGKLLINASVRIERNQKSISLQYSINKDCDYSAKNIIARNHLYHFDIFHASGRIENIRLRLPGRHNVENALAAAAVALNLGVSESGIKAALESYLGVKRRFEYRIKSEDLVFIDDYAHHPEEIRALVESLRNLYPSKKISGIFQPHLYSRTRDFAQGFADSLSLLDEVILLDIYPAREKPIEGVGSELIFDKITQEDKHLVSLDEILDWIRNKTFETLVTIGAGDIDKLVEPIEKILRKKQ